MSSEEKRARRIQGEGVRGADWTWQADLQSPLCELRRGGKEEDLQERRKVLTIFLKIQLRPKTEGE